MRPMARQDKAPAKLNSAKLNYAPATLSRNFGSATSKNPIYFINQHGHVLPHDPDFTTIISGTDSAVHYWAAAPGNLAQDHEVGGDANYKNPGSIPEDSSMEAQEPPKAPLPSRAASLSSRTKPSSYGSCRHWGQTK